MSVVCFGVYLSSVNFCVIVNAVIKVGLTQTVKIIFRLCFRLAANIQADECGRWSADVGGKAGETWRHQLFYLHEAGLKGSSPL